jgi:hypothetical protein
VITEPIAAQQELPLAPPPLVRTPPAAQVEKTVVVAPGIVPGQGAIGKPFKKKIEAEKAIGKPQG